MFQLNVRQSLKKVPKEGKLHPDVIKHWPEVFKDITVKTIPIEYLESVYVTFTDGRQWAIKVNKEDRSDPDEIEFGLEELLTQYEDVIANVDFRLNTKKVKYDIERRTKHFLKKRK